MEEIIAKRGPIFIFLNEGDYFPLRRGYQNVNLGDYSKTWTSTYYIFLQYATAKRGPMLTISR